MTMLSTWRPHRWSQSWSLMASNAASTIRRFCSTLIPSSTSLTAYCVRSIRGRAKRPESDRRTLPEWMGGGGRWKEPTDGCGCDPRSAGGLTGRDEQDPDVHDPQTQWDRTEICQVDCIQNQSGRHHEQCNGDHRATIRPNEVAVRPLGVPRKTFHKQVAEGFLRT